MFLLCAFTHLCVIYSDPFRPNFRYKYAFTPHDGLVTELFNVVPYTTVTIKNILLNFANFLNPN